MTPNSFTCAICAATDMTEAEATAHECYVRIDPPKLAPEPMMTREAVMILSNQLANIHQSLEALVDGLSEYVTHIKERDDRRDN